MGTLPLREEACERPRSTGIDAGSQSPDAGFLAAVMAALLWAIILPDLVPSTARSNIGDVFHAAA